MSNRDILIRYEDALGAVQTALRLLWEVDKYDPQAEDLDRVQHTLADRVDNLTMLVEAAEAAEAAVKDALRA